MKRLSISIAAVVALSIAGAPASTQTRFGVDKLYIFNCGEGHVIDISRWSPGVNVGKSMDFVDSCYLIKHKQGWFLPGTHIPIHRPEHLSQTRPDYILIMPWNLKSEISAQLQYARGWGAQFVVAIPELEVF